MNLKKFVFTSAWGHYKMYKKHGIEKNFNECLKRQYWLGKLLIEKGLKKFYTD